VAAPKPVAIRILEITIATYPAIFFCGNVLRYAINGNTYTNAPQPIPPTIPSTVEIPGKNIAKRHVVELKRIDETKALF